MIEAKKSLGQNFLSDKNILGKIADAASLTKGDMVIEVGPGTGNLTKILAERAGRVIAVEKDHRLIESLTSQFPDRERVQIIEGDVLEFGPASVGAKAKEYTVVGNIPYYITSHFIRTVFEQWPRPRAMVLTVQKEVAQRIVATPPHMNLLALSVQFYGSAEIIGTIKRGSFRPVPKVDSAIIRITPHAKEPSVEPGAFFEIVRKGFSSPRKQLVNNLNEDKEFIKKFLVERNHSAMARPEELDLDDWIALVRAPK